MAAAVHMGENAAVDNGLVTTLNEALCQISRSHISKANSVFQAQERARVTEPVDEMHMHLVCGHTVFCQIAS